MHRAQSLFDYVVAVVVDRDQQLEGRPAERAASIRVGGDDRTADGAAVFLGFGFHWLFPSATNHTAMFALSKGVAHSTLLRLSTIFTLPVYRESNTFTPMATMKVSRKAYM